MKKNSESIRITLAIAFVTFFLALFWSADFISSQNLLIFAIKLYAFVSSACFFFYLLFTAVGCKYGDKVLHRVGVGHDVFCFSEIEVEKFRKWSFDAGVNFIFAGFLFPFFFSLFYFTNNIKTAFSLLFLTVIFVSFELTLNFFFRLNFLRATFLGLICLSVLLLVLKLNNAAGLVNSVELDPKEQATVQIEEVSELSPVNFWFQMVRLVAGENYLGR